MALERARQQVEGALKEYLTDAGRDALQMVFDELEDITDLTEAARKAESFLIHPKSLVDELADKGCDIEKLLALVKAWLASQLESHLKTTGHTQSTEVRTSIMNKVGTLDREQIWDEFQKLTAEPAAYMTALLGTGQDPAIDGATEQSKNHSAVARARAARRSTDSRGDLSI